jgi:uncharacterized phage-associated protein
MTKLERIRFSFDERKAAATAALFLELAGGEMAYLKLLKLLYYADRESLERLGHPISGDRYYAMKHGPVLSRVYDLVKSERLGRPASGPWSEHIKKAGRYELRLKRKPDLGPLSEAEVEIIKEIFRRHQDLDKWILRDKTHGLPEWEDPGTSSREIPIEQILRILGKSEDEIEEVRRASKEKTFFDAIFRR